MVKTDSHQGNSALPAANLESRRGALQRGSGGIWQFRGGFGRLNSHIRMTQAERQPSLSSSPLSPSHINQHRDYQLLLNCSVQQRCGLATPLTLLSYTWACRHINVNTSTKGAIRSASPTNPRIPRLLVGTSPQTTTHLPYLSTISTSIDHHRAPSGPSGSCILRHLPPSVPSRLLVGLSGLARPSPVQTLTLRRPSKERKNLDRGYVL